MPDIRRSWAWKTIRGGGFGSYPEEFWKWLESSLPGGMEMVYGLEHLSINSPILRNYVQGNLSRLYDQYTQPSTPTPTPTGAVAKYPLPYEEAIKSKELGAPGITPPEGMKWEWSEWSPTGEYTGGRWQITREDDGFPIEPMSEYQQWLKEQALMEAEESRRRFGVSQAQWERGQTLEEQQLAWQMRQPTGPTGISREEYERDIALLERDLMAGGPINWVKLWQARNMPSPWQPTPPTRQENALSALAEITRTEGLIKEHEAAALKAFETAGSWISGESGFITGEEPVEYKRAKTLTKLVQDEQKLLDWQHKTHDPAIQEQQRIAKEGMETGYWSPQVGRPTTPPLPEELSPFVTRGEAGQPISQKMQLTTPSLQQWGQTPWATQQKFGGLAEWMGGVGTYRNILGQMEMMRPTAPGGVGRTSWTPTRQ